MPDNTKTAVIKACLYDPQVNRTYAEMAAHYDAAILPARPRRPRDKAKVEQAVLIVERWLLGRLRHRTFYSLAEVNAAIGDLMTHLNEERPIRRLGVTRRQLLEEIDRPALKSLPAEPYEFSEWRTCRVGIDYHVEVAAHYYSVPHRFARAEVEARLTARTVEIFLKGERIAAHMRASGNHKHTTVAEHMPSSHRRYAGWTIERIRADAAADRAGDGGVVRVDPRSAPASRTGLSRLSRHRSARRSPRRRASGSRRRTRHRHRRADLRLGQIHPRQQPRSASRAKARHGRNADPAFQHPWVALLQLGETTCSNIRPSTSFTPSACIGMAKAFVEIAAGGEADGLGHHEWLGLLLDREASWRQDKRFAARLRVAKLRQQACVEDVEPVARNHRRSNLRRRHPRPSRPQRPPHRTRRRKHASDPRKANQKGLTQHHRR